MFTYPRVGEARGREVAVDGLVCSLCASRLQKALVAERSSGVVDLEMSVVRGEPDPGVVKRAIRRSMLVSPVRRLLAWRSGRSHSALSTQHSALAGRRGGAP